MLRFEVSGEGAGGAGDPAPAIDVDDAVVVIGSAVTARIRLPASTARPEHVRIEHGQWRALHALDGGGPSGACGEIGAGVELVIGGVRVRVAPAPAGAVAAPAVRTESLARELVRNLLGDGGAPVLEIERGPVVGAKRMLAPPESSLVIGRGDEATWVIFDGDLSRAHVEVRRGWDGVRVLDRGSKNGTRVDGVAVGEGGVVLRDGARIAIANVVMRYTDPAERHLRAEPSASTSLPIADLFPSSGFSVIEDRPNITPPAAPVAPAALAALAPARSEPTLRTRPAPKSALVFYLALVVAAAASSALVYLLMS